MVAARRRESRRRRADAATAAGDEDDGAGRRHVGHSTWRLQARRSRRPSGQASSRWQAQPDAWHHLGCCPDPGASCDDLSLDGGGAPRARRGVRSTRPVARRGGGWHAPCRVVLCRQGLDRGWLPLLLRRGPQLRALGAWPRDRRRSSTSARARPWSRWRTSTRTTPPAIACSSTRRARRAARICGGQLCSGGWDYFVELDPEKRKQYPVPRRQQLRRRQARRRPTSTTTSRRSAIRVLMRLDRALGFQDAPIHGAVPFALDKLIEAQYPNRRMAAAVRRATRSFEVPRQARQLSRHRGRTHLARAGLPAALHVQRQLDLRRHRRDAGGRAHLRRAALPGVRREGRPVHPAGADARATAGVGAAVRRRHAPGLGARVRAAVGHRRRVAGHHAHADGAPP